MSRYPAAESHSFFFQTFESTAKEHDVCTVEMTQDRYVAICGNAIQDEFHTLKMSRFVRDIRRYVFEYVQMCTKVAATIDERTALVNMRMGMAVEQVGTGGSCFTRHQVYFRPSFLELNCR